MKYKNKVVTISEDEFSDIVSDVAVAFDNQSKDNGFMKGILVCLIGSAIAKKLFEEDTDNVHSDSAN